MLIHPATEKQFKRLKEMPAHAIGLVGESGAGKGMAAEYLASLLLGSDNVASHPYVRNMDLALTKTGIDDVRDVQQFLKLKVPGSQNIKRIIILQNIDSLRHEAQNALLKTLEEPPEDTVIICTYSNHNRVLPTIHSRIRRTSVLPVGLEFAQQNLKGRFAPESVAKAFYMSGGQAGLLIAILNDSQNHELVQAINRAREIIGMTRYQRLSGVDKIVKDKSLQPALILDGLYRLIRASYKNGVLAGSKDLKPYVTRLKLIEAAISDLRENVQAKLVFVRLFSEL